MALVKVRGIAHTYREKLQVKITKIRLADESDGVSLTEFIRSAPVRPVDLIHTIKNAMASITDPEVASIVSFCVGKVEEKLMHYPAAKTHHHAYFAGLAYHMVRMLEIGDFLCKQRPFLNPDLMRAGIILHDIAKPEEMISQFGIVSDYSVQGKLIGHISMASSWITEAAIRTGIDLESEKVLALQHLVLSHHNLGNGEVRSSPRQRKRSPCIISMPWTPSCRWWRMRWIPLRRRRNGHRSSGDWRIKRFTV